MDNITIQRIITSTDYLGLGLIIADNNQDIVFDNSLVKELLQSETKPKTLDQVVESFDQEVKLSVHADHCGLMDRECDFKEVKSHGKTLQIHITPIYIDDSFSGSLVTITDLTDRLNQEKARDSFLGALVHELRTPLTAVEGNSSLLQEDFGKDIANKNAQEVIGYIRSGSHNALLMVNQFLEMSRLEDGRVKFDLQSFDITALISEVVKELSVLARDKNLDLSFSSDGEEVLVVADPAKVRQILTNMIGNAIKFTERGHVLVDIKTNETDAGILVSDTGPGIPEADRSGLFKKYHQASNNKFKDDSSKSTGLGLYIVKMLADGMGSGVWLVSSELNKGSSFGLRLDLATEGRLEKLEKQLKDSRNGVSHTKY